MRLDVAKTAKEDGKKKTPQLRFIRFLHSEPASVQYSSCPGPEVLACCSNSNDA
jgi:hypothetical protein